MNKILTITLAILAITAIPVLVTAQIDNTQPESAQMENIEPNPTEYPNQDSHSRECGPIGISEQGKTFDTISLCGNFVSSNHLNIPQTVVHGDFLEVGVSVPYSDRHFNRFDVDVGFKPHPNATHILISESMPFGPEYYTNMYIKIDDRFEPNKKYRVWVSFTLQDGEHRLETWKDFYVLPLPTQETTSTGIQGIVRDSNDDLVTGTLVVISNNNFSQQVSTPIIGGHYSVGLGPGDYLIQVIGSNVYVPVTVTSGQMTNQNLTLQ